MKKVFKMIMVLAVLVSVEASAQIIMPVYNTGQQQQQVNPAAIINQQLQNQVYAQMATPGTELNSLLLNAYANKMVNNMLNPQVDPVTEHMNAVQQRWMIENMDRNPVIQNSLQHMFESQYETMAEVTDIQNDITIAQAEYQKKVAVRCNPGMNMMLDPQCINIDLMNTMNDLAVRSAVREQATAQYFQNVLQWD